MVSLRVAVPLLSSAALLFACGGPWSRTPQPDTQGGAQITHTARAANDAPVASEFDVRVSDGSEGIDLALTLTNTTSRTLELLFPSGLTHDFFVLDELGREVWRWSGERMFTSAVRTRLMRSGNSVTYSTHLDAPLSGGRYVAVARLHATNFPVTTQVPFTLP